MDGKVKAAEPRRHLAPVAVALHFNKPAEVDAVYNARGGSRLQEHPGAAGHVLGCALRHAQRSVRPSLDDECAAAARKSENRRRSRQPAIGRETMQMHTTMRSRRAPHAARWAGRIMSGLVIVFLLVDGAMKLVPLDIVVETSEQLGIAGASRPPARHPHACLHHPLRHPAHVGAGRHPAHGLSWAARSPRMCASAARCSPTFCSASISAC